VYTQYDLHDGIVARCLACKKTGRIRVSAKSWNILWPW